jgi:hypothetical protein
VASDIFTVTVPKNHVFAEFFGIPPGTYPAATDGVWVLLPEGLSKDEHVIEYGGVFTNPFFDPNDPNSNPTFKLNTTYFITVR